MKHNNKIVINKLWLSNPIKPLGIIKTKDSITHEIHFFIGIIKGEDEEEDIMRIIDLGSKLSKEKIEEFIL